MSMSWQSLLLNLILRLRRRVLSEPRHLHSLRRSLEKLDARRRRRQSSAGLEHYQCGHIAVDRYCPPGLPEAPEATQKVLFFLHGGAYSLRAPVLYRSVLMTFCQSLNYLGIMPDYRLAPEHPHPSAIEDCLACYRQLLAQGYRPENIVLMGDSAGGGLSLSLLQRVIAESLGTPAAAVLVSPAGDWSLSGASYYENEGRDPMFRIASFLFFRSLYLNGYRENDPEVSPLYGSFVDFPPLFVTTSDTELMRDTAVSIDQKVREAGGESQLDTARGLCHDYPFLSFLPEAKKIQQDIIGFCQRAFAKAPS